jgi:hypothetical protein
LTPNAAQQATSAAASTSAFVFPEWFPWVAPAISVVALVVACAGFIVSLRKYWNDQSQPWAQILLKYAEEELKTLAEDAQLFSQMYAVPFETLERKNAVRATLNGLRDGSLRRLGSLSALIASGAHLRDLRAELNSVTDSFFDNNELAVRNDVVRGLTTHYEEHSRKYVAALQEFARDVCKRKGVFGRKGLFARMGLVARNAGGKK